MDSRVARVRRAVAALLAAALAFAALSGCISTRRLGEGLVDEELDKGFYSAVDGTPQGNPGDLIRIADIPEAPSGTRAWRIVYQSTDLAGKPIPVSGILIAPDFPAPAGGRTIVSWAHPTTGTAPGCATSRTVDPFLGIEGMYELLARGDAVVATDYQGMGLLGGTSSYLLGIPEGNAVLDAARAARHVEGAHAGDRVILWGHSQGGQAALFAAERAGQYAPELDIAGVAVAAPAADLDALMEADLAAVSGVTIAAYAYPAYLTAYSPRFGPSAIASILTPAGAAAVGPVNELCLLTEQSAIHAITGPLVGGFATSDPATTEPWQTMLEENSVSGDGIAVPVFVGQGLADQLVRPEVTAAVVERLCAKGLAVESRTYRGVDHALAAYAALPDMLGWLDAIRGGAAPSDCASG